MPQKGVLAVVARDTGYISALLELQAWEDGDPVAMPPRHGGRSRGTGSGGGRRDQGGSGRGHSVNNMEAENGPEVGGGSGRSGGLLVGNWRIAVQMSRREKASGFAEVQ